MKLETRHSSPEGTRDEVEALGGDGCGTAFSYSFAARAPTCPFCGSIVRPEVYEDPVEQAGLILPFTVDG